MIRAMWLRRRAILIRKEKMYKESLIKVKKKDILNRSDPGPMGTSQTPIGNRIPRPKHFNSRG